MSDTLASGLRSIRVETVADGVYAALAIPGRGSLSNAAIVDLGGQTLVFDTLRTPAAATELLHAAEAQTGRPPNWVVNSHWHDDHVAGNQVFHPVAHAILATERTRELMATRLVAEYRQDARELAADEQSLSGQHAAETDPRRQAQLTVRLDEVRAYSAALPAIQVALPTLTFEEQLTLHGTKRAAQLLTYGGGHTESDVFLYLPDERIAFMGDLAFLAYHPWLPDGDPDEWVRILDRVQQLPLGKIIPGHGLVTDVSSLALTRDYINTTQSLARQLVESGADGEQIGAMTIPAPFETWGYEHFFARNLRYLVDAARGK